MPKKKILLIIPNLGKGGAQRVFWQHLDFLSHHFDTYGCVFNWNGAFESDKISRIKSLNVPAGKNWLQKFYFFVRRIEVIRKLKKELAIDISISHLEGADYINILSRGKEQIVCWIHGTKEHDENIEGILGWVRKKALIPLLYRRSDRIVTVSEGIRDELVSQFSLSRVKISAIPNGFDIDHIKHLSSCGISKELESLFLDSDIIATHCRLARQKNLFAMISIFANVSRKRKVKLIILGDGNLKEQLMAYAVSLGLKCLSWEKNVVDIPADIYFLGHFDNPYPIISRSKLYLMTSMWEGFPLALCEAMACRVPVVAADCHTGPREILAPNISEPRPVKHPVFAECGVLMPLAHSEKSCSIWADTICNLLDDHKRLTDIGAMGAKRILDFDVKEVQKSWLGIINDE